MAKITVTGTIDKVFQSGVGFSVVETSKNAKTGIEYKAWFNVFTDQMGAHGVGDAVVVDGFATAGAFIGTDQEGNPKARGSIAINQPNISKQALAAPNSNDEAF